MALASHQARKIPETQVKGSSELEGRNSLPGRPQAYRLTGVEGNRKNPKPRRQYLLQSRRSLTGEKGESSREKRHPTVAARVQPYSQHDLLESVNLREKENASETET